MSFPHATALAVSRLHVPSEAQPSEDRRAPRARCSAMPDFLLRSHLTMIGDRAAGERKNDLLRSISHQDKSTIATTALVRQQGCAGRLSGRRHGNASSTDIPPISTLHRDTRTPSGMAVSMPLIASFPSRNPTSLVVRHRASTPNQSPLSSSQYTNTSSAQFLRYDSRGVLWKKRITSLKSTTCAGRFT
jgi:hypothetical protein